MGLKLREKKKFNKLIQQEALDIVKAATTPTITEEDGKMIAESDTMEPRALDEIVVSAKRGNYSNVGSSDAVNERIGQLWRNKFSGPGYGDENLNSRNYHTRQLYNSSFQEALQNEEEHPNYGDETRRKVTSYPQLYKDKNGELHIRHHDIENGYKPSLEIVSPEFDALMLGRSLPFKAIANNIGTGLYKLADIPKSRLRTAIYNNIIPYGYGHHGKEEFIGIVKDFFTPGRLKPGPKYISDVYGVNTARMQAWRKAMRIPETSDSPIYKLNSDGTYSLDIRNFSKYRALGNKSILDLMENDILKDLSKPVNQYGRDALIGNHGAVAVVETPEGLTMQDSWTLRPLRDALDNIFQIQNPRKYIPKFIREIDCVKLVGGDPFIFKQKIVNPSPEYIEMLRRGPGITTKDLPIPKPLPRFQNVNIPIRPYGIGSTINSLNNND